LARAANHPPGVCSVALGRTDRSTRAGSEQARQLQTGLARAPGWGFAVAPAEIQVIISIVESGQVVEGGETQDR
jgi:hypothetical protein